MTAASSRHPFRTLAAWVGLVVLFVTVALVGEAYWGVGVFVAAVVGLLALVEVVGQKVNRAVMLNLYPPRVKRESVGEGPGHVETVDQVARFDEDWDRACRMVNRWLEEDACPNPDEAVVEMHPMRTEEFGKLYPPSDAVMQRCPDDTCARAAVAQLAIPPYPIAAVCIHGVAWKRTEQATQ